MSEADGFLSRWARRKAQVRSGAAPAEPMAPVPLADAALVTADPQPRAVDVSVALAPSPALDRSLEPASEPAAPAPPPLTMDDVAQLTRESDYSRFVAPGVDGSVRNAAMKKLFTDPHFNVMDGLDTYIDDYGKPDPIPDSMLRMMRQSEFLGLFDHEKKDMAKKDTEEKDSGSAAVPGEPWIDSPPEPIAAATEPEDTPDEDTDLRLQQDDAAGRPGPDQGAGP